MDATKAITVLVLSSLYALIPAAIAKKKGYSFFGWWCYGVLIWIVALPHALLLKPFRKKSVRAEDQNASMQ